MTVWENCNRVLCVRPDNLGDVLMSAPAMAALRNTFDCSITLLTSTMGSEIAPYPRAVDDVRVSNVPRVTGTSAATQLSFDQTVDAIREQHVGAAVIFTVFSQSALPTALMLSLAGVPLRLAYCREN